ncbi:DUF1822 family protein [Microseira wollei]|uniref:TRADD-like N-terminal domain-containing protein n=1 Tax=Microseira wollei NIES-4236 TaxID=2530354 RepID=A0AAV3XTH5_9CYAN|nr:DUF1822 family protein [Microseira wollei]GET44197.1 hypothetical protein MiSe_90230 [Microseira wollei NIES-4236]
MASLRASKQGLARIQQARKQKGWTIEDEQWLLEASKILYPEQDWQPGCYAPGCSESSFKRFLAGKLIRPAVFKAFCQVLELNWEEVVERIAIWETKPDPVDLKQLSPNLLLLETRQSYQTQLILKLNTNFDRLDEQLLKAIVEFIIQLSEDSSLTIRKVGKGCVLLLFEGSQAGCDRIETLFRTGQLTEILGIPVLSVHVEPLPDLSRSEILQQLRQELENLFNADWQPPERLLASSNVRSSTDTSTLENSIRRAKEINLGSGKAVVLVIQITPESEDEVEVNIWVYPTRNTIHLHGGMQAMVLDEFGEIVPDLQAQAGNTQDSIQLPFSVEPGEPFGVRIILGDFIVTEYF